MAVQRSTVCPHFDCFLANSRKIGEYTSFRIVKVADIVVAKDRCSLEPLKMTLRNVPLEKQEGKKQGIYYIRIKFLRQFYAKIGECLNLFGFVS